MKSGTEALPERKLDLKRERREFYTAGGTPRIVRVPSLSFLMIDGTGDPNSSPAYAEAIGALYGVSFGLKFMVKHRAIGPDYTVMPLEGLWWSKDPAAFARGARDQWQWTAMIMQPEVVTQALMDEAAGAAKKRLPNPAIDQLRLERFEEGLAAQLLHIGPYKEEGADIRLLHEYIAGQRATLTGKHHEIYLSDPRRTAPEKLRTILRQPFTMAD